MSLRSDTTRSEHHADSPAPTVRESRRRVRATLGTYRIGEMAAGSPSAAQLKSTLEGANRDE